MPSGQRVGDLTGPHVGPARVAALEHDQHERRLAVGQNVAYGLVGQRLETYSGAPDCVDCLALVDEVVESAWRAFSAEYGSPDELTLAEMVLDEPQCHDWRVVDAAMDRLPCPECGSPPGRGPAGCGPCDLAHGFRFSAAETDREGVPPGNEHAIRVNVAIVRNPHRSGSAADLWGRRAMLAPLLVGWLPPTAEAQRIGALIKKDIDYETLMAPLARLAATREQ
ncbi:hypothetical protein [Herbidospora cretacea]|uniref:hypothetical protein n=1 Tax=Herbidospora cretacea TaxID=28444 RepID=UPI0012F804BE|nr:hypothetical protein [Herbidospora cretacea]